MHGRTEVGKNEPHPTVQPIARPGHHEEDTEHDKCPFSEYPNRFDRFESVSRLLRQIYKERRGKTLFFCPENNCERAKKPFVRRANLKNHMRRIHRRTDAASVKPIISLAESDRNEPYPPMQATAPPENHEVDADEDRDDVPGSDKDVCFHRGQVFLRDKVIREQEARLAKQQGRIEELEKQVEGLS